MNLLKEFVYRLRGEYTTEKLFSMGMTVGKNFRFRGFSCPGDLFPGRISGQGTFPDGAFSLLRGRIYAPAECVHGKANGTESSAEWKDWIY